ncbi:MAG: hypothetical protein HY676_01870 [Chloroflexi bacterium]|nr:hypothetical protein [Chloroflexota bacterium]
MPEQDRKAKNKSRRRKSAPRRNLRNWLYLLGAASLVLTIGLVVALGGISRAKEPVLPRWLAQTPSMVREAYAYAETAQDKLSYLPCYCGCGDAAHGYHRSNYNCFITSNTADGGLIYDQHGANCDMCVAIALTAKQMLAQGKSLKDVRAEVDRRYSSLGPPTNTPPIP